MKWCEAAENGKKWLKKVRKRDNMCFKVNKDKLRRIYNILRDVEETEEKRPLEIGVGRFMCKACELAKIVTNICYDKGYSVSAAKLQKLLVLMHGEHLAIYNKPLFPENVICWSCGVAIKEVDHEFLLHDFSQKERMPEHIAILQSEENVILDTLEKYGRFDIVGLKKDRRFVELTTEYPYVEGQKTIIPNDAIKRVFENYERSI